MKMGKKLWQIFGPLVVAAVAIVILFLLPSNYHQASKTTIDKAASSLSANVLKGDGLKDQAFKSGKFVPFIGSSELSRMDPFHPSVLAEKYHRGYQPFLLGAPGTQSLTHYFSLQAMAGVQHKKAVVIISPQWFVPRGTRPNMFGFYYSPLQAVNFLETAKDTTMDRYAARRLLQMPSGKSDGIVHASLLQVAAGLPLTSFQKFYLKDIKGNALNTQDDLFSRWFIRDRRQQIQNGLERLPSDYSFSELDDLAGELGKGETTSNDFQIKNSFYNHQLKNLQGKLKDSQTHFNYEFGPEYSDFQLLLSQFAKDKMDVLFVIPPVNQRWADYTGLPEQTLQAFDRKITYQLRSQGFNHIKDMTDDGSEDYFMQDTIHLGWRGWLEMDKSVQPFLTTLKAKNVSYQINNHFYTKRWQETHANDVPDLRGTSDQNDDQE
ncbi:D-alanyl-lipoteichoic acid biosynthesis protein DltD [Lactobacillus sp. CC-MHH1034]|uniref:D-alanyl-lipoteichoic acid biosynthesis protein DltD n=1 Tax=Agrilactobacillus fermenti TaxID=2586909 RepID=UPI001E4CCD10|nr:D-alanyl-lipoteichoic acid biosynthesis protein DltD [Agrilactobacillus fermenti]MCD2256785.1 D-alanyl-lipoteichoic acid biosynthesis protein DltD [Agrilactobacillus fermenti]